MKILKINLTHWSFVFLALATQTMRSEMVLDETFGVGGVVAYPGGLMVTAMKTQPDGKIVIATQSHWDIYAEIVRYNSDGSDDVTFGTNGKVRVLGLINSIFLQNDQKIIITHNHMMSRYNIDGTPDRNFGNDEGVVYAPFAPISLFAIHDKLIFIGRHRLGEWHLACYNLDGTPDETFGPNENGINLHTSFQPQIGLQTNGKIVVLKSIGGIDYLERYNHNGSLDATFGPTGTGSFIVWGGRFLTVQTQTNKIIITGQGVFDERSFLERYTMNGTRDVTFGLNGTGIVMLDNEVIPQEIRTQVDGKIIIRTRDGSFIRYTQNGIPDMLFKPENGLPIWADLFALQPDNKIIVRIIVPHNSYSIRRYREGTVEEIEQRRLTALAAQEAARLAAEARDLMRIELEREQCAICLEEDAIIDLVATECRHLFHPTCMTNWRNSGQPAAQTCPSCRAALPPHNGGNQ